MRLDWITEAAHSTEPNTIFESFDIEKYDQMKSDFKDLSKEQKNIYKNPENYIIRNGGPSLSPNRQNYKKLYEEISLNLERDEYLDVLFVDMYSERETIMDLLASLENENYIKALYKKKKLKASGGLSTDTATKLMDAIRQGRSLLEAAQSSNMLSKPLIDFYAASAYACAAIVINSPLHKSIETLKGSHGHTYNHLRGTIEFGGSIPSGTFIHLLASFYLPQIVSGDVKFKYSALSSLDFVQTHAIKLSLISLLASVPELHNQFMQITPEHNIVHELTIQSKVTKNNKVAYIFEIGDGIHRPDIDSLKSVFKVTDIGDANGKFAITIPADKILDILPTIYQDLKGNLWYVEPLIKGLYLPEICLHFLIISALCNIMRYSPYEWNNILSNKISSEFSLLISKYLRLFEIKYPMLLVQQLTSFLPVIQS